MKGLKEHLKDVNTELKEGRKRKIVAPDDESSRKALADLRRQLDTVDAIKGFKMTRKGGKLSVDLTVTTTESELRKAISEANEENNSSILLD